VKPRKLTHSEIEIWPDEHKETYAIILDKPALAHPPDARKKNVEAPDLSGASGLQQTGSWESRKINDSDEEKIDEQWLPGLKGESVKGFENEIEPQIKENRNPNLFGKLHQVPSHEGIEGQILRVTISHDSDYACAVALYQDCDSPAQNL